MRLQPVRSAGASHVQEGRDREVNSRRLPHGVEHSVVGSEAESGESNFIPLTSQTHFLSHSLAAVKIVAQAVRLADDGKLPTSVFQQLTARDISKLSSLMKVPYVQGSEAYCDELETMLENGWKMELGEGIVRKYL